MIKRAWLLLLVVAFPSLLFARIIPINLLHTNDFHSHFDKAESLSFLLEDERKSNPNTILIDAGDRFEERSYLSRASQARVDVALMNALGYNIFNPGDNEFSKKLGRGDLRRLFDELTCAVINSNIIDNISGQLVFDPYYIMTIDEDVTLGFIGLYDEDPIYHQELHFLDPVESARYYVEAIRPQVDIIILITHEGIEKDKALCDALGSIVDIIISASDHKEIPLFEYNGVLIQQAGSWGDYLGKIVLEWDTRQNRIVHYEGTVLPVYPRATMENEIIRDIISAYAELTSANEPICKLEGGDWIIAYGEESNLGNFLSDVMREAAATDIAMVNTYGTLYDHRWQYKEQDIRYKTVPQGVLTRGTIAEIYPFNNRITRLRLTGRQLKQILRQNGTMDFFHFSGLQYKYAPVQGYRSLMYDLANTEILEVTVNGAPIEDDEMYSLATLDWIAMNYRVYLGTKPIHQTDMEIQFNTYLLEYLKQKGTVQAGSTEGRIIRVDDAPGRDVQK